MLDDVFETPVGDRKLTAKHLEALTHMYQTESSRDSFGHLVGVFLEGGEGIHRKTLNKLIEYGLVTVNDHYLRDRAIWPNPSKIEVTWMAKLTDAGEAIAVTEAINRIVARLDSPPYSALCFDLEAFTEAIKQEHGSYEARNMTEFAFWSLAAQHKNELGERVFQSLDS